VINARRCCIRQRAAAHGPCLTARLAVSRQTVLQRVKRGELEAIHVRNGRRKGLRILVPQAENALFDPTPINALAV
jgi:hypothetical protein